MLSDTCFIHTPHSISNSTISSMNLHVHIATFYLLDRTIMLMEQILAPEELDSLTISNDHWSTARTINWNAHRFMWVPNHWILPFNSLYFLDIIQLFFTNIVFLLSFFYGPTLQSLKNGTLPSTFTACCNFNFKSLIIYSLYDCFHLINHTVYAH